MSAPRDPLGISVALLRPLAELLGRLGEQPAAFLSALRIDEAMPPNTYVGAAAVDRELAAIAARRDDPAFALTLAKASANRPLGLFGHMVWLSGTVRDALTRAVARYAAITRRTTLVLDESPGAIAILRSTPVAMARERGRILTELPFASLAIHTHDATNGAFRLRAVRFAHAGEESAAYAEVFRAPVRFGARHDELEIEAAQLDLALAGSDPITSETLEAKVAQLIEVSRDPFLERVRLAVLLHVEGEPSPDAIARKLGIGARTLRRRLEQHGQTLRGVIDAVRRARADELLAGGASVKETAFALGFSEPSAFSRAYKRWTGKAPKLPGR